MSASLVGSEMCIRDRGGQKSRPPTGGTNRARTATEPQPNRNEPQAVLARASGPCMMVTPAA
eukprot:11219685-Alexandrium_andersonii.AAC.1